MPQNDARPACAIHLGTLDAMTGNWPELTRDLNTMLNDLRSGSPDVMKAFSAMAQSALAPKALDRKTKELIALAISVATRCDDCIAFHARAAVKHGASEQEVAETLAMTVYMGAGPSVMYASHAFQAFRQFAEQKDPQEGLAGSMGLDTLSTEIKKPSPDANRDASAPSPTGRSP